MEKTSTCVWLIFHLKPPFIGHFPLSGSNSDLPRVSSLMRLLFAPPAARICDPCWIKRDPGGVSLGYFSEIDEQCSKPLLVDDVLGFLGIVLPNILGILIIQQGNAYKPTSIYNGIRKGVLNTVHMGKMEMEYIWTILYTWCQYPRCLRYYIRVTQGHAWSRIVTHGEAN